MRVLITGEKWQIVNRQAFIRVRKEIRKASIG